MGSRARIQEMEEVVIDQQLPGSTECTPALHTEYRSKLGGLNWFHRRAQYHICYGFSRLASAVSSPKISDVLALNKLVRTLKARPVQLQFHPLKGPLRIVSIPDSSCQGNADGSFQMGIFLCFSL